MPYLREEGHFFQGEPREALNPGKVEITIKLKGMRSVMLVTKTTFSLALIVYNNTRCGQKCQEKYLPYLLY